MGAVPPFRTDRLPTTGHLGQRGRTPLGLALFVMGLLSAYAVVLALGHWDQKVPGLLTDPFGRVLNYGWPNWSGYRHGLSFPDKIVAVAGTELPRPALFQPYPASVLDQVTNLTAQRHPNADLHLLVRGRSGTFPVTVRVESLGLLPWLVLFGGYLLLAWIWLLAAGLSYLVRPDSQGVTAFIRCSLCVATTLITLFDYHTSRVMVPLFIFSCCFLPATVVEMSLRFPDNVKLLGGHPGVIWLPRLGGLLLLLFVVLGWARGQDVLPVMAVALGLAFLFHAVLLIGRCLMATGKRQRQLLLGLVLWLPPYLVLSWMLVVWPEHVGGWMYVSLLPFLAIGTMGITYALLRHNLWDSRVMLPRPLLRPLINVMMGAAAGLLGAVGFLLLADTEMPRFWQALVAFAVAAVALPVHRRIEMGLDRRLFPADAYYRPTIEQLTLRFTDLASKAAVVEAVETTVRQWLPCDRVRFLPLPFVLPPPEDSEEFFKSMPPSAAMQSGLLLSMNSNIGTLLSSTASNQSEPPEWRTVRKTARAAGIEGIGTEQAAALCNGQVVHPVLSPLLTRQGWAHLVIPARFREHVMGLLALSAKRQSQLFNSEDENLLRTIANQAALALACANAYEQVESLRRAQQAAFREEKGAAVGTVAAVIAHEIRFPINFFRMLLEGYTRWLNEGKPPEAEDVEIGREEVDRLERMAGDLRRIATTKTLDRHRIDLRTLLDHVRLLLRDRLLNRMLEIEVDPLLDVDCDRDAMMQILVNLIANALDACPLPGHVGVTATAAEEGRLRLTVWDTGHGLLADVGKLFQPWFTTKKTGTGLGLPITRRLVRAHGWEIGASRRNNTTCFDVLIPGAEWHLRPPPPPQEDGQFESNPLK